MQAVPGDETKFVFDSDGLIVPAGVPEPLNGNPVLSKGLHHRQAMDVFDGRAGQCLLSPVAHRSGAGALTANAPQRKGGHQHTDQRHQRGGRAENRHAQQDHGYLNITVYHRVHHFHTLEFQCTQLRGERRQNVPQIVFGKVPKGHPFQHISQFHPLLCRPFRSDALLKPVFPIGEEKPQQDENDDAR